MSARSWRCATAIDPKRSFVNCVDFKMIETRFRHYAIVPIAAFAAACGESDVLGLSDLSVDSTNSAEHALIITQELINDAPIGPGTPQPSDHCPTAPGSWFAGSGRSKASSNVFGDLTQVELYCVNRDLSQLSGGLATWTDSNGDTIEMTFSAQLVKGEVYEAPPNAPIIGVAQFTGGTGAWSKLTGVAVIVGKQNGDGTATLTYSGVVYLPSDQP